MNYVTSVRLMFCVKMWKSNQKQKKKKIVIFKFSICFSQFSNFAIRLFSRYALITWNLDLKSPCCVEVFPTFGKFPTPPPLGWKIANKLTCNETTKKTKEMSAKQFVTFFLQFSSLFFHFFFISQSHRISLLCWRGRGRGLLDAFHKDLWGSLRQSTFYLNTHTHTHTLNFPQN